MAQLNLNSYWKFDFLNHSHSLGCDGTTTFSSENRDGRLPTLAIGQRREISLEYWLWEAWTCSWDLPSSWSMGCDGSKYLFRNQVYNASARLFSITRSSPTAPYFLQVWTWVKCNEDILYIYNLSQASFRRHSLHNSINTVPQVKSKTICFSSLTYISAVLNGLHQGEWPLQASHTIITYCFTLHLWYCIYIYIYIYI